MPARNKYLLLSGGLAGLLLGAVGGIAWQHRPWTSTATIRTVPAQVPERFVPAANTATDRILASSLQTAISRGNLMNIIRTFNLYPGEGPRLPLVDVAQRLREDIRISPLIGETLQISVTYPDRILAQKITADLVSRIMQQYVRDRTTQAVLTLQFMQDRTTVAGREWEERLAALRTVERESRPTERFRLDADIARRRYEEASAKAAEAELMKSLEVRQQGPALEVLDPAALPEDTRPAVWVTALGGWIAGLVLAWLATLARGQRLPLVLKPSGN